MLLSNEAELLAMEAEKYSGINPIVVDNNNLTIGLDSGFMDAVSSISSTISGLDNKLDISAFTGYSAALDSGLSNAFETVHNDITKLQGDDSYLSGSIDYLSGVVTTGLSAYSAGPNINITDYVISGKDWLDTIQEASAYAAQQNPTSSTEWNEAYETLTSNSGVWNSVSSTQGEIDYVSGAVDNKLDFSAFSDVSGTFLTAHQSISANEWNDVYNTVNSNSGLWSAGDTEVNNVVHNNSATWDTVADKLDATAYTPFDPTYISGTIDNKLDTTAFSDVSGTFLTAHQSLDGYATTAWVDSQGYLTAHQPISADEWNNVYDTVNVYSGSWTGSESSPTASVDSNGSIDIVSSNNTVYFDVNGTWFNDAVNSALPTSAVQWNSNYETVNTNSSVWNSVTGKEDTISYGYSAGAISSINGSAILGETIPYEVYGISAGDNVTIWEENNTLWISAVGGGQGGDEEVNNLVHSNSATWDSVTNKLDTIAFSNVSGSFLTAHQSLEGYATTAWVDSQGYLTAHQPISADEWNSSYETVQTNSASWGGGTTFTGVDTDSTLTGDGLNNPLGVAEVQTLSSNNTISITSANDVVTLGVNETWFNNVNTTVQSNSGTWNSYGSDISYLSATIGDVESLLAQL